MAAPPVDHPTQQQLQRFATGELEFDHAQVLQEHLAVCEQCCMWLSKVDIGHDRFVAMLKRAASKGPTQELPPQGEDAPPTMEAQPTIDVEDANAAGNLDHSFPNDFQLPDEVVFSVGKFGSIQFHAKGGLGEILTAKNLDLDRRVALKFNQSQLAEEEQQFETEAKIAAQLEHPGVVPIYGIGRTIEGRPFQVMRFIRGDTLEGAIKDFEKQRSKPRHAQKRNAAFRQLITRFVSVCNTIAYAHNRGILHCDIKPSNIMLGKYGETLVVDWGLAQTFERDDQARESGEDSIKIGDIENLHKKIAGTPSYMSPERTSAGEKVGPASDIYSLGALLYKIITGQAPYQGFSVAEVLEKVRSGKLKRPRKIKRDIHPALEAICLKAMAHRPDERYETASALADDVESWLADEPVSAYPEPWSEPLLRWFRRHQTVTLCASSALVVVLIVSVVSAILLGKMAYREKRAHDQAIQANEQMIRLSAEVAARMMGARIELRWQTLATEANKPMIKDWLKETAEAATHEKAQQKLDVWIKQTQKRYDKSLQTTSWFIQDQWGVLQARAPTEGTVDENYSYRDYFQGQGADLSPKKIWPPLRQPHVSVDFESHVTHNSMVAFSMPIWDSGDVIGVLVMTVELGEFISLNTIGLKLNQQAVLIGPNGTILHHKESVKKKPINLPKELVSRLTELHSKPPDQDPPSDEIMTHLETRYTDPITSDGQTWWAAFAPVFVVDTSQPNSNVRQPGWTVGIQEAVPNGQ